VPFHKIGIVPVDFFTALDLKFQIQRFYMNGKMRIGIQTRRMDCIAGIS
jgi:hypothetical protein